MITGVSGRFFLGKRDVRHFLRDVFVGEGDIFWGAGDVLGGEGGRASLSEGMRVTLRVTRVSDGKKNVTLRGDSFP